MKIKNTYALYTDKLQGEFKDTFNKIEVFSMIGENSPIEEKREEIMMQVLDMLLEAQQEGASPSKVVGDDIEIFCNQLFSKSLAKPPFLNLFNFLKILMVAILIFSVINILINIDEQNIWTTTDDTILISIFSFTIGYTLVTLVNKIIRKKMFKMKKIGFGVIFTIILVCSLFTTTISVFMGDLIKLEIKSWILVVISMSYLLAFYLYKYCKNIVNKERLFKKKQKVEKVELTNIVEDQVVENIVKDFYNKNNKRIKRGKEPISEEDFMNKFRKEGSKVYIFFIKAIYILIFVNFANSMLLGTITNIFNELKVEYLIDLAIELVFIFGYYKFITFIYNLFIPRQRIARRCIEEQKSIFELAKKEV